MVLSGSSCEDGKEMVLIHTKHIVDLIITVSKINCKKLILRNSSENVVLLDQ